MDFVLFVHPRNLTNDDDVPLSQWTCITKFPAPTLNDAQKIAAISMEAYLLDYPRANAVLAQLITRFGLTSITLNQTDI